MRIMNAQNVDVPAKSLPPAANKLFKLTGEMPTETQEQIAWFRWLAVAYPQYAPLCWLTNQTTRSVGEGAKLKRMGKKAGIPDVFCCVPKHGYHGLFIEFKRRFDAVVSGAQLAMMNRFTQNGYRCEVGYGWEDGAEIFKNYVDGKLA